MTNYNLGRQLGRCLRSCLAQAFPRDEYEVIVVDDCSTDFSHNILEAFGNEIKVIKLGKNVGVAAASNIGIQRSLGMYVIRVDADDYINQNLFLFMSEILTYNKDIGFVYCDLMKVAENEQQLGKVDRSVLENLYHHGAGVMFRKSHLEEVGLYDEKFRNAEDYDLLKRLMKSYTGFHLPLPYYRYVRHANNMTNDQVGRLEWNKLVEEKHATH
ncbi:glycosyltransferase [Candidatus Berkelbacteria bacterium]|nr:glycosyltransferase [Candidatus Berkelbacteria bacterium]